MSASPESFDFKRFYCIDPSFCPFPTCPSLPQSPQTTASTSGSPVLGFTYPEFSLEEQAPYMPLQQPNPSSTYSHGDLLDWPWSISMSSFSLDQMPTEPIDPMMPSSQYVDLAMSLGQPTVAQSPSSSPSPPHAHDQQAPSSFLMEQYSLSAAHVANFSAENGFHPLDYPFFVNWPSDQWSGDAANYHQ